MINKLLAGGMLALAVAGCGGSDGGTGPDPNAVASVVVTAPQTNVTVGQTVQATATALNSSGQAVTGKTVAWSSSATNIATVSSSGLITGVGAGSATINAKVDNTTGTFAIQVSADACASPLALNVGEVRTISGPTSVACVTLASAATETEYIFIAANSNPVPDDLRSYSVTASVSPAAALATNVIPQVVDEILLARDAAAVQFRDAMEDRVRASEHKLLGSMSAAARASTRSMMQLNRQAAASVALALPNVGDTVSLNVTNISSSNLCTNFAQVRAVVKAVSAKAIIALDVAAPTGGFTDTDFQQIGSEFDNKIYATDVSWFGAPTDIDNDGHIYILFTPEINKLTPAGSTGFTGGFFWGGDLFPKFIKDGLGTGRDYTCNASNEREIFYLLVADPAGSVNNNVRTTASVRQASRGTVGHEFQHMINQGLRMFNDADSLEVSWLNESLSHFAEEAVGRGEDNFSDFQKLTFAQVTANNDDYNAFYRQNFLRFRSWLQRPDTSAPTSSKAAQQLAPRGAGWALLRYAIDQYAGADARQMTKRLAAGPQVNVTNFVDKTGAPFETVLGGWLVANYAADLGISGLNALYSYKSWNIRDVEASASSGVYPLLVNALPGTVSTQSLSGSGTYYRLARVAGAPQATFRMQGAGGGNVDFATSRVYVVRTK